MTTEDTTQVWYLPTENQVPTDITNWFKNTKPWTQNSISSI